MVKSWQIGILGNIINFITLYLVVDYFKLPIPGIIEPILKYYALSFSITFFIFGSIPSILMIFKSLRTVGILLAFLMGVLGIIVRFGVIMTIFYILALGTYLIKEFPNEK